MGTFYSPLNPARNEIRIVHLEPGKWDDEINCTTQTVSLDDKPEYITLSYVWGDPSKTLDIKVDGHLFSARINLEKALRRFRKEAESQAFWVDAICINQQDDAERSQQVQVMGSIYKSTSECRIWLGELEEEPIEPLSRHMSWSQAEIRHLEKLIEEQDLTKVEPLQKAGHEGHSPIDVPGAFEIMELLAEGKHFHEMPFFLVPATGKVPATGLVFELRDHWSKALRSLENVLRRGWWSRIWTVQEALLPEVATICVGPYTTPFAKFVNGAVSWHEHTYYTCCASTLNLWMGYSSDSLKDAMVRIMELKVLHDVRWQKEIPSVAHKLFMISIQRSATLLHDHVYGLFGLIHEFFHLGEAPDYPMSLTQLYPSTTIKFMEDAKQLCLLPYARPQYRSLVHSEKERGRLSKLPTWCPDWSTCAWGDYFDIHNHGGFSADKMATYNGSRVGNMILKLDGILLDTIAVVGPLIPDMKVPPAKFVPIIEEWLGLAKERDVGPRAIWECMHVATHIEVGLDKVDMQAALWEDLKPLASKDASIQEMKDRIVEGNHQFCWGSMEWADKRAFFVTEPSKSSGDAEGVSEYRTKIPYHCLLSPRPSTPPNNIPTRPIPRNNHLSSPLPRLSHPNMRSPRPDNLRIMPSPRPPRNLLPFIQPLLSHPLLHRIRERLLCIAGTSMTIKVLTYISLPRMLKLPSCSEMFSPSLSGGC